MFVSFASSYWAVWTCSTGNVSLSARWARRGKTRCRSQCGMIVFERSYSAILRIDEQRGEVVGKESELVVVKSLLAVRASAKKMTCQIGTARTWRTRCASSAYRHVLLILLLPPPPPPSSSPPKMTAITRNLPWFIKDLGVSIVGQVRTLILSTRPEADHVLRNATRPSSRTWM